MQTTWTRDYITRQDLWEIEEEVKKRWKLLLVLLALALRLKPEATVDTGREEVYRSSGPMTALKVLLMDTDAESCAELSNVLETAGFKVITALDAEEAIRKVAEVSLVILDEDLPYSEELCYQIRQRSGVPVILLGSSANGQAWHKAVSIGADAYLKRALSRKELLARVKAILRRYRQAGNLEGRGTDD